MSRLGGPSSPLRWLGDRWGLAVCSLSLVLTAAWCGAALLMLGRGFDVTDEAYYVLSYRWWDTVTRTFSGAQYVYGPFFELTGHSIPALRLLRLLSVLVSHAFFAGAFVRWARSQAGWRGIPASGAVAAGLLVVASGGVMYGWLPLSPGYNDLSLLGTLAMMGCLLFWVSAAQEGRRLPLVPSAVFGVLLVVVLLARLVAAVPVLLLLLGVGAATVLAYRPAGWSTAAVTALGGTTATVLALQLFVMPLEDALGPIRDVSSLVASGTNSPQTLLGHYWQELVDTAGRAASLDWPVAVLGLVVIVLLRLGRRRAARVVAVLCAPAAMLAFAPSRLGIPGGGRDKLPFYTDALGGMALVVALALTLCALQGRTGRGGMRDGRLRSGRSLVAHWTPDRLMTVVVVLALAVLPGVQSLGTGNALQEMAVNQFACWMALFVLAVVRLRGRALVLGDLAASATLCALLVAVGAGVDGTMVHPYRTDPFRSASERVGGSGPLAGLRVSPTVAHGLQDVLVANGAAAAGPSGRAVLAFDEMPGLVLLLDGVPVGEAWYSASDRERTRAGIRAACEIGQGPGLSPPAVLFNRTPAQADLEAMASCGIVPTGEPRRVRVDEHLTVDVYSTRVDAPTQAQ